MSVGQCETFSLAEENGILPLRSIVEPAIAPIINK